LPDATWDHLPAWRGFNLTNRFNRDYDNTPYQEKDFKEMAELGFNFARLAIDYRTYIVDGDWTQFDEGWFANLDEVLDWGEQYGIHVCINLHRIPGYTVASPSEATDLWTNTETQQVAALHWARFAERYQDIPSSRLSFNLLNEPDDNVTAEQYANVVAILATAIREHSPDRLIICDGLDYGHSPVYELVTLKVAQSTRGYEPFNLSHYRASWVDGSDEWPVPQWPGVPVSSYLYGSSKSQYQTALRIYGPFLINTRLRIRVDVVSSYSVLTVNTDAAEIFRHEFTPGSGEGEWETVVYEEEWGIYQNIYNRDYTVDIPAGSAYVDIYNEDGDWMTFSEIGLRPLEGINLWERSFIPGNTAWGMIQDIPVTFHEDDNYNPFSYTGVTGREQLWDAYIENWVAFRKETGTGIIAGEWGCYNRTPHNVVLAWMRDVLENYTAADIPWAVWNFEGSFGILNSGRSDVSYEGFHGRLMDRAMTDLLMDYARGKQSYSLWQTTNGEVAGVLDYALNRSVRIDEDPESPGFQVASCRINPWAVATDYRLQVSEDLRTWMDSDTPAILKDDELVFKFPEHDAAKVFYRIVVDVQDLP